MDTKQRIADEALTLFSEQGYAGTSVRQIAAAVQIKDSSLYKHYASKREILQGALALVDQAIASQAQFLGIPDEKEQHQASLEFFMAVSREQLVDLSQRMLTFYATDWTMRRFWKLGQTERYHDQEIDTIFRTFFLEKSISYLTDLFSLMVRNKVLVPQDPRMLAIRFYSPLFFLISRNAGSETISEQSRADLEAQVTAFHEQYHFRQG